MLSNTFEYSLQRVNPKLSLPYWDFTIEKSTRGGNTPDKIEPQSDSPILQEDWFGSNDPEDGMVRLIEQVESFVGVVRRVVGTPCCLKPVIPAPYRDDSYRASRFLTVMMR